MKTLNFKQKKLINALIDNSLDEKKSSPVRELINSNIEAKKFYDDIIKLKKTIKIESSLKVTENFESQLFEKLHTTELLSSNRESFKAKIGQFFNSFTLPRLAYAGGTLVLVAVIGVAVFINMQPSIKKDNSRQETITQNETPATASMQQMSNAGSRKQESLTPDSQRNTNLLAGTRPVLKPTAGFRVTRTLNDARTKHQVTGRNLETDRMSEVEDDASVAFSTGRAVNADRIRRYAPTSSAANSSRQVLSDISPTVARSAGIPVPAQTPAASVQERQNQQVAAATPAVAMQSQQFQRQATQPAPPAIAIRSQAPQAGSPRVFADAVTTRQTRESNAGEEEVQVAARPSNNIRAQSPSIVGAERQNQQNVAPASPNNQSRAREIFDQLEQEQRRVAIQRRLDQGIQEFNQRNFVRSREHFRFVLEAADRHSVQYLQARDYLNRIRE